MPPRKLRRKATKRSISSARKHKFSSPRVGPAFEKLVAVMARLRAPNGCPWDREQTHATLRTYLIEEAYEVLDALDGTDDTKYSEELGDLLLQVLFHAQIASEEGRFNIADVIREIYEKMIRRHPHVFGTKRAKDAAEVLRNWEIIKREERAAKQKRAKDAKEGKKTKETEASSSFTSFTSSTSSTSSSPPESFLDGVPHTLPALLEALQLTRKAARIGFDWDSTDGIFDKLDEETHELRHALAQPPMQRPVAQGESASPAAFASTKPVVPASRRPSESIESELGDLIYVAVNLARILHVDPEIAHKKATAKFSRRFREMERLAREQGTTLAQIPRPQMESLWDQANLREQSTPKP